MYTKTTRAAMTALVLGIFLGVPIILGLWQFSALFLLAIALLSLIYWGVLGYEALITFAERKDFERQDRKDGWG